MILVLFGNTVGLVFGASSEVLLGDGAEAELGTVVDRGRRAKGMFYDMLNPYKGFLDNSKLRVEDFRIEYQSNGQVDQFYSRLVVEDIKSKERLYTDEIYVNKPLRYGGATIYQADWAIDRLQLYVNNFPVVVPLKKLPDSDGQRAWGAFLPLELVTSKDPGSVKKIAEPNKGIVLVVENMRNVQVYGTNKELAGILRSPESKMEKKVDGMPVQFAEDIKVEGDNSLRLDRIMGATGLIVKCDPGVPFVYAGFALLMPATLLSVLPFGQVWAAIGDKDKAQVVISGRSNRNSPAFEDEMKSMVVSGAVL